MTSILVVDDERTMQETLAWCFQEHGHRVETAWSGDEALQRLEHEPFDVIISDIIMPGLSGLDLLDRAVRLCPAAVFVLITGYGSVETAIEALRRGASDYVLKPFILDELRARVEQLLRHRRALAESRARQRAGHAGPIAAGLIGVSRAMIAVREQIGRIARSPSNVLITGESGTGKELAARAIHAASPRIGRAFVPVNCAAIPEGLLESQLFGHVRGAFTTAVQANPGLFAAADGGTLFLDEIGEMPLHLQVKLLRVIQDKEVLAVGGTRAVRVDARIIASTNRDLVRAIREAFFRADLYYRLNVARLVLPPLRDRRDDIPVLVEHFIARLNIKLGTAFVGVDHATGRLLAGHEWSGNVRELENVLERAMILGEGDVIHAEHLPADLRVATAAAPTVVGLREATRRFEHRCVLDALAVAAGDKAEAARLLGISLASLYRKLDDGESDAPPAD